MLLLISGEHCSVEWPGLLLSYDSLMLGKSQATWPTCEGMAMFALHTLTLTCVKQSDKHFEDYQVYDGF